LLPVLVPVLGEELRRRPPPPAAFWPCQVKRFRRPKAPRTVAMRLARSDRVVFWW
jgi:hypothetical protein